MGKSTKKLQARAALRVAEFDNTLKTTCHSSDKKNRRKDPLSTKLPPEIINSGKRLREILDFRSKLYNIDKRSKEALKFLFCKYPVPAWIIDAFYENLANSGFSFNENDQCTLMSRWNSRFFFDLLVELGAGRSSRPLLKDYLSKAEIAEFNKFTSVKFNTIPEIVFYCKLKTKGISESLCNNFINSLKQAFEYVQRGKFLDQDLRLLSSKILTNKNLFAKLCEFVEFIARSENLDSCVLGDIFDFLNRGRKWDYSFKGRTLASVINAVNEWHIELNRLAALKKQRDNQAMEHYYNEKYQKSRVLYWNINDAEFECRQVTSYQELINEGRAMHNCVASYHHACRTGQCEIFSLRKNGKRIATIEIRGFIVTQARGPCNARLVGESYTLLKRWAKARALAV